MIGKKMQNALNEQVNAELYSAYLYLSMEAFFEVTGLINDLVDLAIEEKDHAANMFLQWFVNEQVEEEKNAEEIVQKLKLMADAPGAMYMLDNEMAQRVFTPPATQGD